MPRTNATERPLVTFIVANYNYGKFIRQTLKSILDQTEQNFEIIVIDDKSTDASLDVVRSFSDRRIHLHVNERNIGMNLTYNKGASLARGKYITYVDSDDWIEPRKTEEQLEYFRQQPDVDIVGTYVNFFGNDGNRHPQADRYEHLFNQPYDLNALDTWVGWNKLISSSVMLTRSAHERIGPRDSTMAIASDLDFWVRAYALGYRFGVVPIPLLAYRLHEDSVSQRDPLRVFLEMSYLFQKNLLPLIETRSALYLISELIYWHVTQEPFSTLDEDQRYRLLALLLTAKNSSNCSTYVNACMNDPAPELVALGRRFHATFGLHSLHDRLQADRDRDNTWRDDELAARTRQVAWYENELTVRDRGIAWRDNELAARARIITWSDNELVARDREIEHRDNELAARNLEIAYRDTELAARDREIAHRDNELAARDRDIDWRDREIDERDRVMKSRGAVARLLLQNILRRFRA